MEQQAIETGWRGSPEAWLAAAYELLLHSGVDSVKILPLARSLGLSRTSFYWFFKDREELLSALLAMWRDKNTGNLVRQANAYAESLVEGLFNVFDCWLDTALFDSKFEFAPTPASKSRFRTLSGAALGQYFATDAASVLACAK